MAVTATTTLGASGYTPAASWVSGVTLADWYTDPLKIKTGPDGDLIEYHNHKGSGLSNQTFTVREIVNYTYSNVTKWCRESYNGQVAFCGYQKDDGSLWTTSANPSCTYGQVQITDAVITASRDYASSPTVNIRIDGNWYVKQAPLESYYNWRVYGFFSKPNGGEEQIMMHNRDKMWDATESGAFMATFSFTETSGNTTIANQTYGVWGDGNGVTYNMNPSMGVRKTYTLNIPKYIPSPFKKYNGSSWATVPVNKWNGSSWVPVPVKRWNGSSWIDA